MIRAAMLSTLMLAGPPMILVSGCAKEPSENTGAPLASTTNTVAEAKPAPAPELSSKDRLIMQLADSKDLAQAVEVVRPMMADVTNSFPPAAAMLAMWSGNHTFKFSDISALKKTTRGRVMKDSASERGSYLCVSGDVIEIEADRSGGPTFYHAGIVSDAFEATRVLAAKSTGDIEANSSARFCGVVIGKVMYNNASGGTTSAPYLFGMFDLPENR